MAQLTEEQRRELGAARDQPLRLIDPDTNQEYVLVRADIYDHLKALLYDDSEFDPARGYAAADEIMKEDWDDPKMADYDRPRSARVS
jgi:hypothetical protein